MAEQLWGLDLEQWALWWSDEVCGGAIFSYGGVLPGSLALGILVTL